MPTRTFHRSWEGHLAPEPSELPRLIAAAGEADPPLARLCLHRDDSAPLQEMVVAIWHHFWVPPHRQEGREKSYTLLHGALGVLFFDDDGDVTASLTLGAPGLNLPMICRFDAGRWHTVLCRDDHAVYLETVTGPFRPGMTSWRDTPVTGEGFSPDALRRRVFGTDHAIEGSERLP